MHDPSDDRLQISSYDADTSRVLPGKTIHGPAIREAASSWTEGPAAR